MNTRRKIFSFTWLAAVTDFAVISYSLEKISIKIPRTKQLLSLNTFWHKKNAIFFSNWQSDT